MARKLIYSARLFERIRKLQNLSQNNPSQEESESAARQAMRLMMEHCLTQADLDAARPAAEDPLVDRRLYIFGLELIDYADKTRHVHAVSGWKRALAVEIADYLGLRSSYVPGTALFDYYGHASDVQAAVDLFAVCAKQIQRKCLKWLDEEAARHRAVHGSWSRWDASRARSEALDYKNTAVSGLSDKFDELKEEAQSEHAEAFALVVDRKAAVSSWVDANYSFKKGTGKGIGSDSAGWCAAGYTAGKNLELTEGDPTGLSDGGSRAALSGKSTRRLPGS